MDMGSSTMNMAATTASSISGMAMGTPTMAMPDATSTAPPMSMEGMGDGCKISMLWNWNTIDACFISSSWRITSRGMFAGSCIGVILLVMSLELLRRASREYDTYILRQFEKSHQVALSQIDNPSSSLNSSSDTNESAAKTLTTCAPIKFRPNLLQQVVRATLHMVQFTIAYFVMLLAMYYNGYIIISIVIGAWLGAFVFSWEGINMGVDSKKEATYCCG